MSDIAHINRQSSTEGEAEDNSVKPGRRRRSLSKFAHSVSEHVHGLFGKHGSSEDLKIPPSELTEENESAKTAVEVSPRGVDEGSISDTSSASMKEAYKSVVGADAVNSIREKTRKAVADMADETKKVVKGEVDRKVGQGKEGVGQIKTGAQELRTLVEEGGGVAAIGTNKRKVLKGVTKIVDGHKDLLDNFAPGVAPNTELALHVTSAVLHSVDYHVNKSAEVAEGAAGSALSTTTEGDEEIVETGSKKVQALKGVTNFVDGQKDFLEQVVPGVAPNTEMALYVTSAVLHRVGDRIDSKSKVVEDADKVTTSLSVQK